MSTISNVNISRYLHKLGGNATIKGSQLRINLSMITTSSFKLRKAVDTSKNNHHVNSLDRNNVKISANIRRDDGNA